MQAFPHGHTFTATCVPSGALADIDARFEYHPRRKIFDRLTDRFVTLQEFERASAPAGWAWVRHKGAITHKVFPVGVHWLSAKLAYQFPEAVRSLEQCQEVRR